MLDAVRARAFLLLQYMLPKHFITAIVYRLTRIRLRSFKNLLIRAFAKTYGVDTDEAADAVPEGYADFNAFFTRSLKPGSRPVAAEAVVSPVDGTVSAAGDIQERQLLQAKGRYYELADLLASDIDDATAYDGGKFATIYLAPHNYHRVHCPVDAQLRRARYVPGDLFSVNVATVSLLPELFARNERLIMHFDTARGPMMLLFVGALNVGSITTNWTGEIRPVRRGVVQDLTLDPDAQRAQIKKGELLGWFNMGSTVILLFPRNRVTWDAGLAAGNTLRMGEAIGRELA
ncbi:MAG: phosphatidylserine decarboxylase [Gammaproteobacteria bacterium]|nr:phosphatidylserine decarboxylase [Gammaproteobacteria bacterium]